MHWSERYIGQPYISGDQDCAALAEREHQLAGGEPRLTDIAYETTHKRPPLHPMMLKAELDYIRSASARVNGRVAEPRGRCKRGCVTLRHMPSV